AEMPATKSWNELPDEAEAQREAMAKMSNLPEDAKKWMGRPRPIAMRSSDARSYFQGGKAADPESNVWIRSRDPIGDDQHMHQVILAYASDMNLLSTA